MIVEVSSGGRSSRLGDRAVADGVGRAGPSISSVSSLPTVVMAARVMLTCCSIFCPIEVLLTWHIPNAGSRRSLSQLL